MNSRLILGSLLIAFLSVLSFSSRAISRAAQQAGKPGSSASPREAVPFPQVPRIRAEEVQRRIKEKGDVIVVDTDDSEVYESEHIKGAVNIVYDPTTDARAEDQSLSALPGNKLIVFYCNCPHEEDSAPMVMEMWELGYDRDLVKALEGGLSRWEHLRFPLVGTDVEKETQKGL